MITAVVPALHNVRARYANFLIETKKDGQGSRTQLQLATKNNPGLVERYFIYVSQELAKKLKNEGDGLDLMGYVEFQRNYRCGCWEAMLACCGGVAPAAETASISNALSMSFRAQSIAMRLPAFVPGRASRRTRRR